MENFEQCLISNLQIFIFQTPNISKKNPSHFQLKSQPHPHPMFSPSRAVAAEGHRDARHGGGTVGRQPRQARGVVVLCEAILGAAEGGFGVPALEAIRVPHKTLGKNVENMGKNWKTWENMGTYGKKDANKYGKMWT